MEVGKTFSVPDERLSPRAVGWTRTVHNRFGTAEADSLLVAQALGHSSVGGAFNSKVAVLTAYGLVERGQGKIRVTDIGRMIVSPRTAREAVEGASAALFKVSLWQRLHRDYTAKGLKIPTDLAPELARIAGITITDARTRAEWITRAYSEDLAFLDSVTKSPGAPEGTAASRLAASAVGESALSVGSTGEETSLPTVGEQGQILFASPDDKIQISVPRSAKHIGMLREFVESALKAIEEDLSRAESPAKPKKHAEK
jgi:hypothetical protein